MHSLNLHKMSFVHLTKENAESSLTCEISQVNLAIVYNSVLTILSGYTCNTDITNLFFFKQYVNNVIYKTRSIVPIL